MQYCIVEWPSVAKEYIQSISMLYIIQGNQAWLWYFYFLLPYLLVYLCVTVFVSFFFSTMIIDWLGKTSVESPILRRDNLNSVAGCFSGVYELQLKAFIGRAVVSGPQLLVSIQPDATKPVSFDISYKPQDTYTVGSLMPGTNTGQLLTCLL